MLNKNVAIEWFSAAGTWVKRHIVDIVGVLIGFLYGLPTVLYRMGHDQGIFFYIGREWLKGRLPLRDAFDVKPPGIYFVYAVSIALFGENPWAPRLLEVLLVPVMGILVALAVRRDSERKPGEIGIATILVSSFYFSNFCYWDTTQAEFFEAITMLGSLVCVERAKRPHRSVLAGGMLAGFSLLTKPSSGLIALVIGLLAGARGYRNASDTKEQELPISRKLLSSVWYMFLYGVGAIIIVGICVLYYVAHRAGSSLLELIGYIKVYSSVRNGENGMQLTETFWGVRAGLWTGGAVISAVLAFMEAKRERSYNRIAGVVLAFVLFFAAYGSVAVQNRWHWYHWGVCAPFVALLAAYGMALFPRPSQSMVVAVGWLIAGFYASPKWAYNAGESYFLYVTTRVKNYLSGKTTAAQFAEAFNIPPRHSYRIIESVGLRIKALARPGDQLHVRSFEPIFYVLSGLATPTRFPSEFPLEEPTLAFNRDVWITQRDQVLWTVKPRFIVTYINRQRDIADITRHDYYERFREGPFVVMERNPPR